MQAHVHSRNIRLVRHQHAAPLPGARPAKPAVMAAALPLQLPDISKLAGRISPLSILEHPQQQLSAKTVTGTEPVPDDVNIHKSAAAAINHSSSNAGPVQEASQPATKAATAAAGIGSLKFAKHLANVTNGCAPSPTRFESLGWLLFESKRLQAAIIGPGAHLPGSWLDNSAKLQLLEQVYVVGMAVAELGTADGLQPLGNSNGSRAIVSLDYSKLLERYLLQHGQLLTEQFWSQLHAYDDLQAKAIHVATALETRCTVYALMFNKLIEKVGTEGSNSWPGFAWGSNSGWPGAAGGPLAAAITNTMINATQQHSSPVSNQSTVASPSAASNNDSNNSNNTVTGPPVTGAVHGFGWLGQLGVMFVVMLTLAGKVVKVVVAVCCFAKDVLVQLLVLRAAAATAKALAAAQGAPNAKLQPAVVHGCAAVPSAATAVGSGAVGWAAALPAATPQHPALPAPPQPPAAAEQPLSAACNIIDSVNAASAAMPAVVAATSLGAGSLGLLGASPLQQCPAAATKQQQQQQCVEAAAAPHQQQQPSQRVQQQPAPESSYGLRAIQQLLQRVASRHDSHAAFAAGRPVLAPSRPCGPRLKESRALGGFKAGSGQLLYSLWSPEEACMEEYGLPVQAYRPAAAAAGASTWAMGVVEGPKGWAVGSSGGILESHVAWQNSREDDW